MMGQGLGDMLSGGSSGSGGGGVGNIQSMLSGLGSLNRDHELVGEVNKKQDTRSGASQAVYSTGSRCTK